MEAKVRSKSQKSLTKSGKKKERHKTKPLEIEPLENQNKIIKSEQKEPNTVVVATPENPETPWEWICGIYVSGVSGIFYASRISSKPPGQGTFYFVLTKENQPLFATDGEREILDSFDSSEKANQYLEKCIQSFGLTEYFPLSVQEVSAFIFQEIFKEGNENGVLFRHNLEFFDDRNHVGWQITGTTMKNSPPPLEPTQFQFVSTPDVH